MTLAQSNGNDRIYTPPPLAKAIVEHFQPSGLCLEPCRGKGAFFDALLKHTNQCDWFEIDEGSDFLRMVELGVYPWIITNPPWSLLRPFLQRSMQVADNIVFLCLTNALFYTGRQNDIEQAGFGIREIARVKQPKKPWPQCGFMLSANWLQRGWNGPITMSKIDWNEDPMQK